MPDFASRTIAELAPALRSGAISPVDVTGAVVDRIERLEPVLRSYVLVDAEGALRAAEGAEREIADGRWRGPLHGIPVAIKDSLAVAGWPTTNASPLMAGNVTNEDAAVVERLRAAGATVLGKSNLHEWAMGGTCTGMPAGTVRNPWALDRVPGGSSGGSAAAVSAGLALGAVGTDGMGSLRTPASYCGIVGLKPTPGLVPRRGELPANTSPLYAIGPLARDVRDSAILLAAIAGHEPTDPTSRPAPAGWRVDPDALRPNVEGLRVGVPRAFFLDDATPPVRAALEAAASLLSGLGASVRDVELPQIEHAGLVLPGLQSETQDFLFPLALANPDGFASRDIRNRILANDFVRAVDARRALRLRARIRRLAAAAMADLDLLLTPTNSTQAFPIGADEVAIGTDGGNVSMRARGGQSRVTTRLTLPFNVLGLPAISIPAAPPDERPEAGADGAAAIPLPIGLQLVAHPWHEATLLEAALALEAATGAGFREPPLASVRAAAIDPDALPVAPALGATR
ncbi:MAG TPA: amidase [Candidatus Limnocylindrales bacterium]|nr:amidase [Candidatus Limnocylindrales bacterium]